MLVLKIIGIIIIISLIVWIGYELKTAIPIDQFGEIIRKKD